MSNTKTKTQSNATELIRAILSSEAKFIIAVVSFVIGVVAPYYQMKQDVALIQKDISVINSNHEVHIQDLAQQVKDTITVVQHNQEQIRNLQVQQAVLLEKLTK